MDDKLLPFFVILAVCIALFFLSVYKIYMWAKDEEASRKFFDLIKQRREKIDQLEFAQPVFKFRSLITWILSVVVILAILHSLFFPYAIHRKIIGSALFFSIILSMLANNFVINKYWRCPFCQERLPIRIGRSGARPQIVHSCPYCQKDFLKKKSGSKPDLL